MLSKRILQSLHRHRAIRGRCALSTEIEPREQMEYDVVTVGGGPAGNIYNISV